MKSAAASFHALEQCKLPERRPVIKRADDCSNFDDYSSLGPMKHDFELSSNEQALFSGF